MIRLGTKEDLYQISKLGRQFYDATNLSEAGIGYDPESVMTQLEAILDSGEGYIVVYDDDGIKGMSAAVLYRPYLNLSQLSGQEMFWWVDPNYRGNVGRALLQALEDEARERGASTFTMMALDSSDGERVGKLYKRRGYMKTETHYMRAL